jgi:bacterial/archaeal transporter family-2 protein
MVGVTEGAKAKVKTLLGDAGTTTRRLVSRSARAASAALGVFPDRARADDQVVEHDRARGLLIGNDVAQQVIYGDRMNLSWLFVSVALLAGTLVTVQTGSNARLKEAFGEALPAVIVSSSLGIILLVAMTLIARIPWPSLPSIAGTPWWGWLGGALGAVYAVTMVLLARELGAATLTALAVTGQLVCSVMLDHFGWVGFNEHAAGIGRIVGCLLMVAGFFLIARF